jgi:hypothetical protein
MKMQKEELEKWIARVDETFRGPSKKVEKLADVEQRLRQELQEKFNFLIPLVDSFLDFYLETFESMKNRSKTDWSRMKAFFTSMHISTFWRFRSSYNLFWNGYYIDAASLLRAVFENVLQIAALQMGIISLDEILGGVREDAKEISDEGLIKYIRELNKKLDGEIYVNLIGNRSGLTPEAQEEFERFMRLLHSAVHKCKTNIIWYYGPWVKGERAMPVFPEYTEELVRFYVIFSTYIAWMVVRTLPLLQLRDREFSEEWHTKYQVLDGFLQELVADFKGSLERPIKEFVFTKLTFL